MSELRRRRGFLSIHYDRAVLECMARLMSKTPLPASAHGARLALCAFIESTLRAPRGWQRSAHPRAESPTEGYIKQNPLFS